MSPVEVVMAPHAVWTFLRAKASLEGFQRSLWLSLKGAHLDALETRNDAAISAMMRKWPYLSNVLLPFSISTI